MERPLDGGRGRDRVGRACEDAEARVALTPRADDLAVVLLGQELDDRVVLDQRLAHLVGVLVPQAGRALDVREQERDRPRRQLYHFSSLRRLERILCRNNACEVSVAHLLPLASEHRS